MGKGDKGGLPWFWKDENESMASQTYWNRTLTQRLATWEDFPFKDYKPTQMEKAIWWYSLAGYQWDKDRKVAVCYYCDHECPGTEQYRMDPENNWSSKLHRDWFIRDAEKSKGVHMIAARPNMAYTAGFPPAKCRFIVHLAFAKEEVINTKMFFDHRWGQKMIWQCAEHLRFNQQAGVCKW